ncbi:FAD-binding, type 2 [Pseudocohnilembus persalinus]|uniref:FAD-binding, type 2 n=1 Tax=Pseudocohnilembus persalinus TaxID=266149 RepID=A0A0V0QUH7_PSEPJ|nr:FAD-binding, type 2 [Pseudocohnilembus persalinus]|eukprot:KRX05608.1 FAD-binding, type 2 [Pseudocohnilembus persalinus]
MELNTDLQQSLGINENFQINFPFSHRFNKNQLLPQIELLKKNRNIQQTNQINANNKQNKIIQSNNINQSQPNSIITTNCSPSQQKENLNNIKNSIIQKNQNDKQDITKEVQTSQYFQKNNENNNSSNSNIQLKQQQQLSLSQENCNFNNQSVNQVYKEKKLEHLGNYIEQNNFQSQQRDKKEEESNQQIQKINQHMISQKNHEKNNLSSINQMEEEMKNVDQITGLMQQLNNDQFQDIDYKINTKNEQENSQNNIQINQKLTNLKNSVNLTKHQNVLNNKKNQKYRANSHSFNSNEDYSENVKSSSEISHATSSSVKDEIIKQQQQQNEFAQQDVKNDPISSNFSQQKKQSQALKQWYYTQPGDPNWPTIQQFQEFKKQLKGTLILKGEDSYQAYSYDLRTNSPKPACFVYAQDENDVAKALKFAKNHEMRVSVSSTVLHQDHRNIVDNGVHISLINMQQIDLDLDKKQVTVQTGNRIKDIIEYLEQNAQKKYVIVTAGVSSVGIYGWTTQGGAGALSRLYGLGADNIVAARMVLVNGEVIDVNENNHPELLRAIRGSGASTYGVGISLTLKLQDEPGKVTHFSGKFYPNQFQLLNELYQEWDSQIPNFVSGKIHFDGEVAEFIGTCFGDRCEKQFQIFQVKCLAQNQCILDLDQYPNFYDYYKNIWGPTSSHDNQYLIQGAFHLQNISTVLSITQKFIKENENKSYFQCTAYTDIGGEVSTIAQTEKDKTTISSSLREASMMMTCYVQLENKSIQEKQELVQIMDNFSDNCLQYQSINQFVYWNEPQHNVKNWTQRYWGGLQNYNRLLKVKKIYDPENFLTCYHCVGYNQPSEIDPSLCPNNKCSCSNVYDENTCADDFNFLNYNQSISHKDNFRPKQSFIRKVGQQQKN